MEAQNTYARSVGCFDALFQRLNDQETIVTVSQHTYKYVQTTAHARILTFYETKKALVMEFDVFCHEDTFGMGVKTFHGTTWRSLGGPGQRGALGNRWRDVLTPHGIETVLDRSELLPEVVILCRRIFRSVVSGPDVSRALLLNPPSNSSSSPSLCEDVVERIVQLWVREEDATYQMAIERSNTIPRPLSSGSWWPFKVQGIRAFSRQPSYRVCLKDVDVVGDWVTIADGQSDDEFYRESVEDD